MLETSEKKRRYDPELWSDHKWTPCITGFYFRVLISESSVSDGSHLGKAGVTPRSVVLSDTVFRNDSQQGRLQQTLKCHRKWCHMSDYVCTVPSRSTDWNETLRHCRERDAQGVNCSCKSRCYFANPNSPLSSHTFAQLVSRFGCSVMCYICKLKLHVWGGDTGCLSHLGTAQFWVMCMDREMCLCLL